MAGGTQKWVRGDGGRAGAGYLGDVHDCVARAIAAELPYRPPSMRLRRRDGRGRAGSGWQAVFGADRCVPTRDPQDHGAARLGVAADHVDRIWVHRAPERRPSCPPGLWWCRCPSTSSPSLTVSSTTRTIPRGEAHAASTGP